MSPWSASRGDKLVRDHGRRILPRPPGMPVGIPAVCRGDGELQAGVVGEVVIESDVVAEKTAVVNEPSVERDEDRHLVVGTAAPRPAVPSPNNRRRLIMPAPTRPKSNRNDSRRPLGDAELD